MARQLTKGEAAMGVGRVRGCKDDGSAEDIGMAVGGLADLKTGQEGVHLLYVLSCVLHLHSESRT